MKALLRIAVSAAVLGLLFQRFDAQSVADALGGVAWPPLLGALTVYLVGQAVSAWRWTGLAREVGFRTPFPTMVRYYWIGMFFSLAIPSTLGSDASRAFYLARDPPGTVPAVSSILFDRIVGLIVLVWIGAVALVFGPRGDLPTPLVWSMGALAAALLMGWLLAPNAAAFLPAGSRLRTALAEDLAPFFRNGRVMFTAVALSAVIHLLQVCAQAGLAAALGLDLSPGFVVLYHPLVTLAAAVPITIGGFGLREAAYAFVLPNAGVTPDQAIALSLLWWAVGATGGLLGGLVYALSADPAPRPPDAAH